MNMKKIINIASIILSLIALIGLSTSCKKSNESEINPFNPAEIDLQIVSADVEYQAIGGVGTIKMNSSDFTISCEESWLTAKKVGDKIEVTVTPNESPELRTALLLIKELDGKSGVSGTQRVSISQFGTRNIMDASPIFMALVGGKVSYDISQVVDPITVTLPDGADQWIKYTIHDGILEIEVLPSGKDRKGTINVSAGVMKLAIPVTQQLQYADLIGDYNAHYWLEIDWTERNKTWTLSPLVENESFILSGFGYDMIVNYDPATRTMTIPCGTHDLKINPSGYFLAAWVGFEFGSGSLWGHGDFYFEAPLNTDSDTPQFHFVFKTKGKKYTIKIDGKETEVFPKGMIIWSSEGQLKLADKDTQLFDLTITKK